jgi:hypothetical protein
MTVIPYVGPELIASLTQQHAIRTEKNAMRPQKRRPAPARILFKTFYKRHTSSLMTAKGMILRWFM